MKIHEYRAKEILAAYGIPVPRGRRALTPQEAGAIAQELGGPVVVKAQIHAGGRGKAGGVRLVPSPQEAAAAAELIGRVLVTHQTGPQGVRVKSVLVEEAIPIQKELYLGMVVDRAAGTPVVMASEAGGIDIEEVAAQMPEKILTEHVDPVIGFQPYQGRKLAFGMGLEPALVRPAAELMTNLYRVFLSKDCSLAEINPLVITGDGRLLVLDAKLTFDDNALFRHPEVRELRDVDQEEPAEREAADYGISYVKLEGTVGCMVNGAGLAMATMDLIQQAGGAPANFLDVGGGASADQVTNAFKIILADPNVRAVLVNIFGGIARGDVIAQGIIEASKRMEITLPLVVRLTGTNAEEGMRLLEESGLRVTVASGLRDAAAKAVAAAGG